jgi:hypothetical protein
MKSDVQAIAISVPSGRDQAARRPEPTSSSQIRHDLFPQLFSTGGALRRWRRPNLEQALCVGEVLQAMLTKVDELNTRHYQRRGRADENLATVTGGHNARRSVQRRPEVVAIAFLRLTRMNPIRARTRTVSDHASDPNNRCASTAAAAASVARENAAANASPAVENT